MTSSRVLDLDVGPDVTIWCDRQADGLYVLDWTTLEAL